MPKYWKSKRFEELNEEWNKKLKESGFKDIEKQAGSNTFIDYQYVYKHCRGVAKEIRTQYFLSLSHCVQEEKSFEDHLDQLIMERTAEGVSIKEISDELRNKPMDGRLRSKHNRNTIRYVRRRYENKWGLRIWKPEQMVSRKKKPPTP